MHMLGYLVRRLGTRSGPPQTQGVAGDDKWVNSGKSAGILGMRRILVLLGEPRQVGCLFSSTTCKGSVTRRESAERDAVEDTLFHRGGKTFHFVPENIPENQRENYLTQRRFPMFRIIDLS
ncbi:hypothetical protein RUM44_012172 [Polyplax serrata]|uniref:Uncharacterized protein n=1 Tax=Polyplax serrata TaxID=468196 RepID=A0ABR1BAX6_POLSC